VKSEIQKPKSEARVLISDFGFPIYSMALLWLSCPHCRVLFHIDDANAGMQVKCRACGGVIRIPGAARATPLWYYTRNRQPIGPIPFEQLRQLAASGQLSGTDLVWQEGMPAWTPAVTVVELLSATSSATSLQVKSTGPSAGEPVLAAPSQAGPQHDDDIADVIEVPNEPAYDELEEIVPEVLIEVEPGSSPPSDAAPQPPVPSPGSGPGGPDPWAVAPPRLSRSLVADDEPIKVDEDLQLDLHESPPPAPEAEPQPAVAEASANSAAADESEPTKDSTDYEVVDDDPPPESQPLVIPSLELDAPEPLGWEPEPTNEDPLLVTPAEQAPVESSADDGQRQVGTYGINEGDKPAAAVAGRRFGEYLETEDVTPPSTSKSDRLKRRRPLTRKQVEKQEEDRFVRQRVAEARRDWRRVSLGIKLIYGAVCTWTVTWALFILIANIASVTSKQPAGPGGWPTVMGSDQSWIMVLTAAFVSCVGFLVDVTSIVGYSFCLFAPQPKSARPLAIASLGLAVVALLFSIAGQLLPVLLPIAILAGFVRWLIFMLFLRIIADYFDARGLKEDIDGLLIRAVAGIGVWVLAAIIMIGIAVELARDQHEGMAKISLACAAIAFLFLMAAVSLWYLRVLRDSGALIEERLYRG
jgi:predicted Zn finger-like uncharacterized protein